MTGEVTIIVAILSSLAAIATAWFTRRKISAESGSIIVGTAEATVQLVNAQMERMRTQLEQLEWHVDKLEQQLTAHRVELRKARERIEHLEAFIRLNTDFDPDNINGTAF